MANINITISYNPTAATGSQWSLTATGTSVDGSTVEINDSGANPIGWSIGLAPNQSGTINFSTTTTAPGVKFTDPWPGDPVTGNSNNWRTSLDNSLEPDDPSQNFEYTVNAVYTPPGKGANPANISWDPDVEENPPAQLALKRR